jgi:hypothetical protein
MCLILRKGYNDIESLFNGRQTITCYKYLRKCFDDSYVSPFYGTIYPFVGMVKSNRESVQLSHTEKYYSSIEYGIHVYTSRKTAEIMCGLDEVVVPVLCERKDFVALNKQWDEAVFTKVRIHKRAKLGVK